MNSRLRTMTALGALLASVAFAGCDQREQAQAERATENAATQIDRKATELGRDAAKGMERAKESASSMAQDAKQAAREVVQEAREAGVNASDKVGDAVITSSVKAELAKDSDLKALQINVDTDNGRVALRGTAPTVQAREHATVLASAVSGVVSVDNQLTVASAK